jgi:hypothetical protein
MIASEFTAFQALRADQKKFWGVSISPVPIRRQCRAGKNRDLALNPKQEKTTMRFMVLVKATKDSEAGVMPDPKILEEMGKFNEELIKAGVMLAGEGLQPSSKGARIRFTGNKRTVIDGPFTETKELVAGYWIIQVKSKEEALEWMKRCPNPYNQDGEIELRQVFELTDFEMSPELRAKFDAMDSKLKERAKS